jgi:hypothetical protein
VYLIRDKPAGVCVSNVSPSYQKRTLYSLSARRGVLASDKIDSIQDGCGVSTKSRLHPTEARLADMNV